MTNGPVAPRSAAYTLTPGPSPTWERGGARLCPRRAGTTPSSAGLHLERHALRQRQRRSIVYLIGRTAHVGFPGVRSALAPAALLLPPPEAPADLGPGRPDVDVGDAAVGSGRREE